MPTTTPLLYQVLTVLIVSIYLRTRNFDFYMVAQLALFLFGPFMIQWSVGGFVNSGGVMLFALLAPAGAMVVYGLRESAAWFAVYVVLMILSVLFDYYAADGSFFGVPMRTVVCLSVINFTMLSSIVYLLTLYLMRHKATYLRLKQQYDVTPPRGLVMDAKGSSMTLNQLFSKQSPPARHTAPSRMTSVDPNAGSGSEWNALTRQAGLLHEKGEHAQAILLAQKALQVAERKRAHAHPEVIMSLENLALLYFYQREYALAESLFKRAFTLKEEALGADDPALTMSLNYLADLCIAQQQYSRAEAHFMHSLIICEKALYPNHPRIAACLDKLGRLYVAQGQYAQAEPFFSRAKAINEHIANGSHLRDLAYENPLYMNLGRG